MVSMDSQGRERWQQTLENGHIHSLVADGDGFLAVGLQTRSTAVSGWAVHLAPDGTVRERRAYDSWGDGPMAAVVTSDGYVLAGRNSTNIWLESRNRRWSKRWSRSFDGGHNVDISVIDLLQQPNGFAVLARDSTSTFLTRTDSTGQERWTATYAPSNQTPDATANLANGCVSLWNDEFILAGKTSDGQENGPDAWSARVGQPGTTTPVRTPPKTEISRTRPQSETPSDPRLTSPITASRQRSQTTVSTETTRTTVPGFGIGVSLAALIVGGYASLRQRRRE